MCRRATELPPSQARSFLATRLGFLCMIFAPGLGARLSECFLYKLPSSLLLHTFLLAAMQSRGCFSGVDINAAGPATARSPDVSLYSQPCYPLHRLGEALYIFHQCSCCGLSFY